MIVKTRVHAGQSAAATLPEWLFVDRVRKVQTYRIEGREREQGRDEDLVYADGRVFRSQDELREWVDSAWGSIDVRVFEDEIWPELSSECAKTVLCVRLEHDDGRMTLGLFADETFLLSDTGDTIERIRS